MDERSEPAQPNIGAFHSDAAAIATANSEANGSAEARAFLRQQRVVAERQATLLDIQIADAERETRLRHWSLRFGNFSAVMKVAFEIAVAFIFLAIAVALGAAIWTASRDNSLVIEAFSVPPDMTVRGLTGQAVASQLQDRLAAMQEGQESDTARPAGSYVNNWGNDIKVQIPDTGISVGEFYRVLTNWLGHQTHISGEVYRTGNVIAITARASGTPGTTIFGTEKDFGTLVQKAAEAIYARTQTYRYAIYLIRKQEPDERRKILLSLATNGRTATERVWALNGIASMDAADYNDLYSAVSVYRKALAIEPRFVLAWTNIGEYETTLGHDEAALNAYRHALPLFGSRGGVEITDRAATALLPEARAIIAECLGDFETAQIDWKSSGALPDYSGTAEESLEAEAVALAEMHDIRKASSDLDALPPSKDPVVLASRSIARFLIVSFSDDWVSILGKESQLERALTTAGLESGMDGNPFVVIRARRIWPIVAYASAATGRSAAAHARIDRTPLDCYFCVRIRAGINAAEKNWKGADYWFTRATAQAPSLPFAFSEWGEALLAKGDFDGAIAKFEIAHEKGPHFADPLEMCAEALIQKNRSDLALTKFAEADKYAPNWGRLHLKWGEALIYVGKKDEAQKQFASAASLYLTNTDKAALATLSARAN